MTQLSRSLRIAGINQMANIRMSKLNRLLESARAKTNWNEMAKMLFVNDDNGDRQRGMEKIFLSGGRFSAGAWSSPEWEKDQLHFVRLLIVIVAIAESRTQEIYEKDFSQRCDSISQGHGLEDDQYWNAKNVPAEWKRLNTEFEQVSNQILVGTLREFHQNEIADLVRDQGSAQIFNIIRTFE